MEDKIKNRFLSTNSIIPFGNVEKEFHEGWYKGRHLMNFPHPFRWVIVTKPNGGKTTLIQNVVGRIQAQDPFKRIILVHGNPNTEEYNNFEKMLNMDIEITDKLPDTKALKGKIKEKRLYILDDFLTKGSLDSQQKQTLSDIFSNLSTHDNVSIIVTSQYLKNVPPAIRDLANIFTTGYSKSDEMRDLAHYIDIDYQDYKMINSKILKGAKKIKKKKNSHNTITYDKTPNSPMVYRINLVEGIN